MTVLEAVETVLKDAGKPLHYREITHVILERGLWKTHGKTPEATINAQLAVDIKRKGRDSKFQRRGPGLFGLREWRLPEWVPIPKGPLKNSARTEAAKRMSFTDATEHVLEHFASREPMHYRAITDKVMELNLVATEGRTPEATLYAQVITEIKRKARRGEQPRFVMHGKGIVGLSKWMGRGLAFQIEQHNRDIRKKLFSRLREMSWERFEELVAKLLAEVGFEEVSLTSYKGDKGIDVRGTLVVGEVIRTRMAVQVKRWKQNVQAPVVQQVRGSLGAHEQGLIITTSDFSFGARREAERPDATPVALMNGEQLVNILVENNIAVQRTHCDLVELDEEQMTAET